VTDPLRIPAVVFGAGILGQALLLAFSERLPRDKILLSLGVPQCHSYLSRRDHGR